MPYFFPWCGAYWWGQPTDCVDIGVGAGSSRMQITPTAVFMPVSPPVSPPVVAAGEP
jgi:hypothetical protein